MGRVGVCALLIVLGLSACAAGPTLEQATAIMKDDGATLSRLDLRNKVIRSTDDLSGCQDGTKRHVYSITGDFGQSTEVADGTSAITSTVYTVFQRLGYSPADGPQAPFGVNVSVLRKDALGITFTVGIRPASPNVEITGKTDCLAGR